MSGKPKTKRNAAILAAYARGDSKYLIAKRRKLSWTRVNTIIKEETARQKKVERK